MLAKLEPTARKIFISTDAGCHLLSERAGEKAPSEQHLCVAQRRVGRGHTHRACRDTEALPGQRTAVSSCASSHTLIAPLVYILSPSF